ncbi:MAG: phosphate ABC transporter substrate-binding/OmpA family protein [Pseudomonadota bacterium]
MWNRGFVIVIVALMALASPSYAKTDLSLHGSNTVGAELAPALLKGWLVSKGYKDISEKVQADNSLILSARAANGESLSIELQTHGSSTGFKALEGAVADIGMSSRQIKAGEVTRLKSMGKCDTAACEYVVGLDGIAVIVNSANPLNTLTKAQLRQIFSGEVKNWSELGGAAGAIKVYSLDNLSGTYDTFKSLVMGKGTPLTGNAVRNESHQFIARQVARESGAIGFVGLPFVDKAKALSVSDGEAHAIKPGRFSVATEDYVLARRLFLYLPEIKATKLAREFVDYAISDAGQAVVARVGFVSQEIVSGKIELDDNMPDEYHQLAEEAQRLSLNFRFLKGTIKLDNKAQRDVERLSSYMAKSDNGGKMLMLFGFADANESMPFVSLQLSVDRADLVADLLVKHGMRPQKVRGYGNAVPIASNKTEEGRNKNRRVEVWLR